MTMIDTIVELQPETPKTDRVLRALTDQWNKTADECIKRAEELETAAFDLRERANRLRQALTLADEVKGAVLYEIQARTRAATLALVNPSS